MDERTHAHTGTYARAHTHTYIAPNTTTAGLISIRYPAQQDLSRVDAISLVTPPPHLPNSSMRMIVD